MSTIAPLGDNAPPAPQERVGRPPQPDRGQLMQLEKQLSEWVHCASANTQAGRDKIAEISARIDAIKGAMQQETVKRSSDPDPLTAPASVSAASAFRFDGVGAWLDVRA